MPFGQSTGVIATAELLGRHPGTELEFHASGEHGRKLDLAYIVRDHVTLNPNAPVLPLSC